MFEVDDIILDEELEKRIILCEEAYNAKITKERYYRVDYVFDADKSVNWNREKALKENKRIQERRVNAEKEQTQKIKEAEKGIVSYIADKYNVAYEKVEKLFNFAKEECHEEGLRATIDFMYEIMLMYLDWIN